MHGATIQRKTPAQDWGKCLRAGGLEDNLSFGDGVEYRIKPEPKYRPFKNKEECWQEMQKHQPFGWVKTDEGYEQVWHVNKGDDFNATFKTCTFADGTPFGIKEK